MFIIFKCLRFFWIIIFCFGLISCSSHYYDAVELEKQKRWEEAAIEYKLAFIENPNDQQIQEGLKRVNPKVVRDYLRRYYQYLKDSQFHKAYRMLTMASELEPNNENILKEQKYWFKILIGGKVDFLFDRLQANIRLADEMNLKAKIKSPTGEILIANISNESGFFFVEDLIYRPTMEKFSLYTLNGVGLQFSRNFSNHNTRNEYKSFIDFRTIHDDPIKGMLKLKEGNEIKGVAEHRINLAYADKKEEAFWEPPRRVIYQLKIQDEEILVNSSSGNGIFAPSVLYMNIEQNRVFVDFGNYQLKLDPSSRKWAIRKNIYNSIKDDYFSEFSKNLALYPFFFYDKGIFKFVTETVN